MATLGRETSSNFFQAESFTPLSTLLLLVSGFMQWGVVERKNIALCNPQLWL
jgi:hypothetical protein